MKKVVVIKTQHLLIHPMTQQHLKFLLKLWNDPEIMRYAGFAKNWNYAQICKWFEKYKKNITKYGNTEIHFIVKLKKEGRIGESGLGRLRSGWSCPNYKAPKNKLALMTDVKLIKPYWNKGYGTEVMKTIVQYVFSETEADILLVPPHKENIPAIKVYEKTGFKKTKGIWYRYHMIYEINKNETNKKKKQPLSSC